MKKTLSVILVLAILFATLPIGAMASQVDEHEQLLARACLVFPEYAERIRNPEVPCSPLGRSIQENTLIVSEEKDVSEKEKMLYSEYADGTILLTDVQYDAEAPVTTVHDRTANLLGVYYDITIKATCTNISGSFTLSHVKLDLLNDAYDRIANKGTISYSDKCWGYDIISEVLNESASGKAVLSYRPAFQHGRNQAQSTQTLLTLTVGDDGWSVTHKIYT